MDKTNRTKNNLPLSCVFYFDEYPFWYIQILLHTTLSNKTRITQKQTVANTGVPQHEHFRWLLLWFKTVIKALVFIFTEKLQKILRLYVDLFSLIIVSKRRRSNRPFRVVNFCWPNMMKFKHLPALNLTFLLMEQNLFRIPGCQC